MRVRLRHAIAAAAAMAAAAATVILAPSANAAITASPLVNPLSKTTNPVRVLYATQKTHQVFC